jgi:hypothetical protein
MPSGQFGNVRVRAVGRAWILPGRNALEWINACAGEDNTFPLVFPGMISHKDGWDMWKAWQDHEDAELRCANVARVALSRAARREWWWAHNMINEAVGSWTSLNGRLVREGVRAATETLPDWLDAAYTFVSEHLEEKERNTFQARLSLPPKNIGVAASSMSNRAALEAFARL